MINTFTKRNILKCALVVLLVIALSFTPQFASATTTSTALAVSATVISVCIVAATPMVFGNYSGTSGASSPLDATSVVTVTCTLGVPYSINMDAGIGTGSTVASRILTSGSNTLNYSIYTDSGHTSIWGDGTNSTSSVSGTGGLIPQTHTAYGRIPGSQLSASGAYLDTVTVTLTY